MAGSGTIRCGSFVATVVGYNKHRITCDWLPEWEQTVECTLDTVARVIMVLQSENRGMHVVNEAKTIQLPRRKKA